MKTPCIGLALGSGSARGWAHIGVIQALAELKIKPDVVCGCSIGALVGAAYVLDVLDDLDIWARSLQLKNVIGFFDISLTGGGVAIGERLFNFFRQQVGDADIESLSTPFASVATELSTGREIWFKSGSIIEAVRASVSLPGLVAPVSVNGRHVVDGGLVNPVPVSICRAMGADIVIAVNLNSDLLGRHVLHNPSKDDQEIEIKENNDSPLFNIFNLKDAFKDSIDSFLSKIRWENKDTPGLFDVLASSINIMQDRITRSRMAGDPPDIILEPRLGQMGLLEFYKADESIEEGKKCVLRVKESLREIIQ